MAKLSEKGDRGRGSRVDGVDDREHLPNTIYMLYNFEKEDGGVFPNSYALQQLIYAITVVIFHFLDSNIVKLVLHIY